MLTGHLGGAGSRHCPARLQSSSSGCKLDTQDNSLAGLADRPPVLAGHSVWMTVCTICLGKSTAELLQLNRLITFSLCRL